MYFFLQEAKLSIHTAYLLFFIQLKANGFFVDKKYFDQTETEGFSKWVADTNISFMQAFANGR
jgi:hypothetical protein